MDQLPGVDRRLRRAAVLLYGMASLVALLIANVPGFSRGYSQLGVNGVACSGLVCALVVWRFPWHRFDRNLFLVITLSASALVALMIKLSGGTTSPFDAYWYLIVLFASLYYTRLAALLVAVSVTGLSLLPLLYSSPDLQFVLRHLVMGAGYVLVVLIGNILPMEVLQREQAKRDLEADLRDVRRLRDEVAAAHALERIRTTQLRVVHDIGREIGAVLDPHALPEAVVRTLHARLDHDIVAMFVREEATGDLVLASQLGLDIPNGGDQTTAPRVRPGAGIVGSVAQTREPYRTGDVRADPRYTPLSGEVIRSEAAVPILVGGNGGRSAAAALLGVLDVQSERADEYDEVDVMALEAVADQVGVALVNARVYERANRQAKTDALTGLLNHRALMERLDEEVERARRYGNPLSVLFLDIDRFKAINDTYGHQTGDAALQELAQLGRESLRSIDLLGRYGGEEFLVVLPEVDVEEASLAAERLRSSVAARALVLHVREGVRFTVSVGVASYPHDGASRAALLHSADQAMYRAKQGGRNRVCVAAELDDGAERHLAG